MGKGTEERIDTEITIGYKAKNKRGINTIELQPTKVIIRDQSPEAASAHLAAIVGGVIAPAQKQAQGK